jgi:Fe-Mn family superoxide dismutase
LLLVIVPIAYSPSVAITRLFSGTLPKLDYAYNALEPYIDARTMVIRHTKHHQTYIDKLNTALEGHGKLE